MSEYYSSQEDYEAEMDAANEPLEELKPASFADLKISDNDVVFEQLLKIMNPSQPLHLVCGIDSGMAFYEFETENGRKRKLYLHTDLMEYVIYYLINGCKKTPTPNALKVDKNIDETYIIRLFKRNRDHGVSKYNPTSKEYKAVYRYGIIKSGALPYTPEELSLKMKTI